MEEKILPIISLKEEPPKQNKPKDGVGDSLLSSKPLVIVIINSNSDGNNNNDDNNDNDTILLPVPTAS